MKNDVFTISLTGDNLLRAFREVEIPTAATATAAAALASKCLRVKLIKSHSEMSVYVFMFE